MFYMCEDITDSDNARTLKAKTSAFGEKTLVEIFTPITKVFNSSSHEKLSAERCKLNIFFIFIHTKNIVILHACRAR